MVGPPTYPATVTSHDLRPGGRIDYHMIGPEGDQVHGYWMVDEADPPRSIADPDGNTWLLQEVPSRAGS